MSRVSLNGASKRYGNVVALEDINLELAPGEIVGLTGPSGAGKSTLCRIIAGIDRPDSGSVAVDGQELTDTTAPQRDVAFMFESFALYPHLTVFDNIAFPLRAPKRREIYDGEAIAARVEELTTLVEIDHLTERFPSELSGGQKQRVALCRALVQEPSIYLLDEPISHLDAQLRHKLRGALRRRLVSLDKPSLWVSPDAMEVVSVADRVVVLIGGVIQQIGEPMEVYHSPSNVHVARLVGDPAMNLITGRLAEDNGTIAFRSAGLTVSIPPGIAGAYDLEGRQSITLGVRPNKIHIVNGRADADGQNTVEVYTYEPFGKYQVVTVRAGDDLMKVKSARTRAYVPGEKVTLDLSEADLTLFDAETGHSLSRDGAASGSG